VRTLIERLGHLAVWAGLYAGAAVPCFAQVAGLSIQPRSLGLALAFVVPCGVAVYLLDRVKLRDAWLDPADAAAQPRRMAFLSDRAGTVRVFMILLLLAATAAGAMLARWMALLPWLACAAVFIYAGRPRAQRPRPKDVLIFKNATVAAGITACAALAAVAAAGRLRFPETPAAVPFLAFSAAHVFLRVFADAALCDLDDETADRAHGTQTLPTALGRRHAWNVAMALRLALAAALIAVPIGPWPARLAWALVTIASSLALRWANPRRLRDWVDARFPLEALIVWLAVS
jgi:4-hydroxybenzoate polyprenyltransferase